MSRVLLIGQAPGPRTDPALPLFPVPRTSAGGRLVQIMGIPRSSYLRQFDRMNLLPYFPGRQARGDKFPMAPARLAAQAIRPLLAGRRVVLVGTGVSTAFGLAAEFHEWVRWSARRPCLVSGCDGTATIAVVPHPSGRNYWYNKEDNRRVAREFWSGILE